MKNERFSAKSPSFINALKIICERSQLFEEAINKEDLPTDEEAVAIIADLTDSLPLNDEEFSFNGLSVNVAIHTLIARLLIYD